MNLTTSILIALGVLVGFIILIVWVNYNKGKHPKDDNGIIRPWNEILDDRIDEQKDKRARKAIKEALDEEHKKK